MLGRNSLPLRLSREDVGAPPFKVLEARLDETLSNLILVDDIPAYCRAFGSR